MLAELLLAELTFLSLSEESELASWLASCGSIDLGESEKIIRRYPLPSIHPAHQLSFGQADRRHLQRHPSPHTSPH
ncbi:hypothetical protein B0H15DRAFT_861791 [Mycena belliarum]|uniref:Uncharacterized protein n=1 Tax=Mycena belliarum TaxID=1033014 RepID=A0AAD6TTV2_9AGAR|nr:hypothetical protein B0H15DRAFT_861791 [Mycena belliae]